MVRSFSLAALLAASVLAGCGGPLYAAHGRAPFIGVDVEIDVKPQAGSRFVDIALTHLFAPSRVAPNLTQYVVWIAPVGGAPLRAATVVYNEGNQTGEAQASFPDSKFTILVTAETAQVPATPSEHIIIEQLVDLR